MAPNGPANPPTPTPDRMLTLLLKAQGNGARQLPRWGEGWSRTVFHRPSRAEPGSTYHDPIRTDPIRPDPSRSDPVPSGPIRSHPSRSIPIHPDPRRTHLIRTARIRAA